MVFVDTCVACGSRDVSIFKAHISPFISHRVWKSKPVRAELVKCKQCSLVFYNPRLDESENSLLYRDYRGSEYQKERQKFEDRYTAELNEAIGKNDAEIRIRKQNLLEFIKPYVEFQEVKAVLDFGGDRGQFILDEFTLAKKYVYDISGVQTPSGVQSISDFTSLQKKYFDFVMCCHILEHLSYPLDMLGKIHQLGNKDTLFYFEVPLENPCDRKSISTFSPNLIGRYLFFSNPLLLKLSQYLFNGPTMGMHEHVNLFSVNSLENLLIHSGFSPVVTKDFMMDLGRAKSRIISCLCKKRQ